MVLFGNGFTETACSQRVLNVFSPKDSDSITPIKTMEIISPIENDAIEIPDRILKKIQKNSLPPENSDIISSVDFDKLELPPISKKKELTPISEKKKLTWEEFMKEDHSKGKKQKEKE